ncbi:Ig-like domain repeat protein [Rhodococcus sp. NPDC054953]
MSTPSARRIAVPITSAAVVAGMVFTAAPAGAAPTTTPFTNACQASATLTVHKTAATSMTVDAPASVDVGQTFTYRIQPGGSSYPDSESGATTTNISRLKVDYEIPANATFVSAAVVPGTGVNIDGVAPSVLRVNTSGVADAAGSILRLSGDNQVIANGANNSTNSEGGIRAPKLKKDLNGNGTGGDSWFRLPAVDVTVTASGAGTITPKVRTAGSAAAYNNNENYYSFLPRATFWGSTQWAPTRCTPRDGQSAGLNAGAGALATITVNDPGPVIVDSTTTLTVPGTAKTGAAVDLTATVTPAGAGGTVEFKDGATSLGTAPVDAGSATLRHTFTADGTRSITAVYSGDAGHNGSTSAARTIEVSTDPVIVDTTTAVNVPATAKTGAAVTLTASLTPNTATGTVEFKDGATPLGTAPVAAGVATLTHTFTTDGDHTITAVYSGDATHTPSTSAPGTVEVSTDIVVVDSTTTVAVPATAAVGAAVDLKAIVSPNAATGTVEFRDGAEVIGSAPVVDGVATLSHTFTTDGDHTITAVYSGDSTHNPSTAAAETVRVSGSGEPGTPGGGFGSLENLFSS